MSSRPRLYSFLCALTAAFTATALAQSPPIRIMPLGDSITDGSSFDSPDGTGGYRGPLYDSLSAAGYNVDYIGSLTINSGQLVEKNHEGHSGWRIDQLDSNMAGWLAGMDDPDVVLMHIGTNDFGQNNSIATAIDRLDALILKIATLRPYAHIIVTNLMERGEPHNTNIQTLFNPFVQGRVNDHAAAGRRVTFLDMRAACPLSDMPDNLHPDQNGYNKMAAAWLPAIQAVIGPDGDGAPPAVYRARGSSNRTQVTVTFSKPVADGAANIANFSINNGVTVSAAELDASKRIITLTTSEQAIGTTYTLTVNNVPDRITPTPNTIAPNSTIAFTPLTPRGYVHHVPESAGYTLAYSLDVPNVANYQTAQPAYSVDNRTAIGPFSRVAYWIELQTATGDLQYLWASMDAFTNDVNRIAVPTSATGAIFQQNVTNLNVVSNVAGIVTGTGLSGNLEFWPTNYSHGNAAEVPGANDNIYDFGDSRTLGGTYGSMQLHNAAAAQTLFAFNNWGGGTTTSSADIGIGNNPSASANNSGPQKDWTFSNNAAGFQVKQIQVLVQTTSDLAGPSLSAAVASFARTRVTVSFSEPLAPGSVKAENFSLDGGVVVLAATLAANQRDVALSTTVQPEATPLTLSVSNVRDSSANANRIAAGSTIAVAAPALPPEIVANVGAPSNGYHLVASINVPVTGNFNAGTAAYTLDERTAPGTFTRVAYYLELQRPGTASQFVWVSADAFTTSRTKVGVPLAGAGSVFQKNLTNMDVVSNVAGVVNGSGLSTGNIEFWPSNYSQAKNATLSPANASDSAYDFGDSGAGTAAGHGSMQIHNYDIDGAGAGTAGQTLFSLTNFGNDGNTLGIGIGNNPSPTNGGVDWTFAANAGTYTRRVLHVLVLPGATTPAAITSNVPEAANYQLVYSLDIPATGNFQSGTGFTPYAVNHSAETGPFTRVAYYLELQKTGDPAPRFVWTSMDAFTTLASRVGVPTNLSGSFFQQNVSNLNVVSNVAGVTNGTGIATGNIEFWPGNYNQSNGRSEANGGAVPGASPTAFDFGDGGALATAGHGSMQVHNYGAAQTIWALNRWGAANHTGALEMGIGNNPMAGQAPDYTLTGNAASWDLVRKLHVFVLPGSVDSVAPTITTSTGSTTLDRLTVSFSEPLADGAASPANFSIDGGLTVTGATLLPGHREIALTTSAQTPGTLYTVTATGIRDRSAQGNLIAGGATTSFTAYTPAAVLANVPDTGYILTHRLAIPSASGRWNVNTIPYSIDESKFGERPFDRVAYLLELDGDWAYASFDPHTTLLAKIGVPTLGVTSTAFQQKVTNMNVASNVAGIVAGNGIATGNIEFWGGNYDAANSLSIPNASGSLFDFGDNMTAGAYGTMQIHNHDLDGTGPGTSGQTILAYNQWGSNVATSQVGIGNNPTAGSAGVGGTQGLDYTFTDSAAAYTTRNLYILVRPSDAVTGPAPQLFAQPSARSVTTGGSATLAVQVSGSGPFTYQWRRNGVAITGATNSWLDLASFTSDQAGTYDVVVTNPTTNATTISEGAVVSFQNTPPTFSSFAFTSRRNEVAIVAQGDLLTKASDIDGHPLSITAAGAASAQGGTVTLEAASVNYTPVAGFLGADTFTITISDGNGGTHAATVHATVTSAALNAAEQPTVARRPDGKVDAVFYGTPGESYIVERNPDLNNPLGWDPVATVTAGDDGVIPMHDPNPPAAKAFYRARPATP